MRVMPTLSVIAACMALGSSLSAQTVYTPPQSSAEVTKKIDFKTAKVTGSQFTLAYRACDQVAGKTGCKSDPNSNSVILLFPDETIFFDAKLAIDADGSSFSKIHSFPNQPETSLRYSDGTSLDAEQISYVVIPLGPFGPKLGAHLGDVAAIVKDGHVAYAIVGDEGPAKRIGEGSIRLHEGLGRDVCIERDSQHHCSKIRAISTAPPVLFFIFHDSHEEFIDKSTGRLKTDVSPQNLSQRVVEAASRKFQSLQRPTAAVQGKK